MQNVHDLMLAPAELVFRVQVHSAKILALGGGASIKNC
jgi:hypothetical protein